MKTRQTNTIHGHASIRTLTLAAALLAAAAVSRADTFIYVANSGNNTIEMFTSVGVGSLFANSGLNNPQTLALDSAGNLYVANYGSSTIEKFTPGGVGSVFASTGLSFPNQMLFDNAGDL